MSKVDKYKIGYWKKDNDTTTYHCSCGHTGTEGTCKCGNTRWVNLNSKKREVIPYIEVIQKDRNGFKLKRTNLSVFHDDDGNVQLKENMIQVLTFNILKKELRLFKNGKFTPLNIYSPYDSSVGRFFSGSETGSSLVDLVSCEETVELFKFIWQNLCYKRYTWGDRKFHFGLIKYITEDYSYIQILANAGYPNLSRFYEKRSRWNAPSVNMEGTNPKDILGVPKFMLRYIREDEYMSLWSISQIKQALKKIDGNRIKELLEIVKDEGTVDDLCRCMDTLIEIHDKYNYNNIKKLTLYIFREIRMNQGISSPTNGATLLRDYISMSTKLGQEFEKYPKSLKKEHDITVMNYKVKESEIKQQEFAKVIQGEDYKFLEHKSKKFSIITPSEMQDLIREGSDLSHCVASYVNDIVSEKCKILFMRKTEDLDKPYATVEVRGGNVRQARGYANRRLNEEERSFLVKWAEQKELQINYY